MTAHSSVAWDWQTAALWLLAHVGAVVMGMMVVMAWWRRHGNQHLRGLRVRGRFQGVDCLRWAATRWYSPSRQYWLLRYPRE
jgi:hypothetical protein